MILTLSGQHVIIIESARLGVQVPLADHRRLVAAGPQQFRHILLVPVEIVGQRINAVVLAVFARHDAGPAWRTDRIGNKTILQPHTLSGNAVDIRRP